MVLLPDYTFEQRALPKGATRVGGAEEIAAAVPEHGAVRGLSLMNNLARLSCGCFVRRRDTLELSDLRLNVCRNQFFIAMLGSLLPAGFGSSILSGQLGCRPSRGYAVSQERLQLARS